MGKEVLTEEQIGKDNKFYENDKNEEYKLHGFALLRHRIILKLEILIELLFDKRSFKENMMYLLTMSLISMVAIFSMDSVLFKRACEIFHGPLAVAVVFILVTFFYYLLWLIGGLFKNYLLMSILTAQFAMVTIYFYAHLKYELLRPRAAEEYGMIFFFHFHHYVS